MTMQPGGQPPRRQGPRPLGLHLTTALTVLLSSPAGLPFLRNGSLPLPPSLRQRAQELASDLAASDPDELARVVDREMRRRLDLLLTGVERYRRHTYRRNVEDPPAIWQEGRSRLLDFGGIGGAGGMPVLFVPSLVNRGYILDLSARKSLARWLTGRGMRVFVLDWGAPGPDERPAGLDEFIAGRLLRAAAAAKDAAEGQTLAAVGYCMGGLLALAAVQQRPDLFRSFVALATPWDFHADDPAAATRVAAMLPALEPALRLAGELPVDAIQTLFAALDPLLVLKKFSRFARLDPASPEAEEFVALEDWLNDGIALPADVARDCMEGWYGQNTPGRGMWKIAGRPVRPEQLRMRSLVVVPSRDRIVPPASAAALGALIPEAEIWQPNLGHIGMIVSGNAPQTIWEPLHRWLAS
ncbi:alpha/beta fold hydrolase [Indioceanicola profundi]|uniref:alpha/beta fold hydrolase n=1 Tax=Indioceanicola profundi TaxID=2220096 RepID=UPI0013C52DF8|nr:alpha/beta fold hydrolase [Indioceanicola profundi]